MYKTVGKVIAELQHIQEEYGDIEILIENGHYIDNIDTIYGYNEYVIVIE